eukprot:CAMPEP_0116552712 /NCGR_PEP_ID=MMETSP0397-20121206/6637_1 /TAXON_ID=216820 /ORGANISM="Cyclophora tenuis, Strain ECT3854" /LENGTH=135 /DNA_ID=CAMNT_0004077689 /DNA_START=24 /DNA_END=428 /DNA_ORIENTATION=+
MGDATLARSSLSGTLLLVVASHTSVDAADVELEAALEDLTALLEGNSAGDLNTVSAVVHHEDIDLGGVEHAELKEAVGEQVLGLVVRTEANVHVAGSASELAAELAVDTAGGTPALTNTLELIALVALEVGSLLV